MEVRRKRVERDSRRLESGERRVISFRICSSVDIVSDKLVLYGQPRPLLQPGRLVGSKSSLVCGLLEEVVRWNLWMEK